MVKLEEYGFYSINTEYLEYLNKVDSEVYYNESYKNNIKPFIGIIVIIENYNYFIPISSAKAKHAKLKNSSNEHFLIYEKVNSDQEINGKIYKKISNSESLQILSILDIKKMIPVPPGEYHKIIFEEILDTKYRDFCRKEYIFCLSIKEKFIKKVEKIYLKQKETKIVGKGNCNFLKLEEAMKKWEK